MNFVCTVLALSLTLVASGADAPRARTAAGGNPSDAEVERAIQARFAKSKIAKNNFKVRVQGGVATIDGATDVIQHKGTATRMARSAGARSVVNRIQISEAARRKAADRLSGVRRAGVKMGGASNP